MPYKQAKRRSNPKIQRKGSSGFPDGLNTLPHPSTLKDTELSELINGVYSQYGSISKRLGTTILGNASPGADKILYSKPTYNVGGTDRWIRISDSGKPEVYSFTNNNWTYLSATEPEDYTGNVTFDSGIPVFDTTTTTWIAQVDNKIIFSNAVDDMIYLEGSAWKAYQKLDDPSTKASVAKTGSATGTATHYYYYVWYNESGGTLASPGGEKDVDSNGTGYYEDMPIELDADTFLTVTVPTPPTGTTRVGIFKSNRQGDGYYLGEIEPTDTTFKDDGTQFIDTFAPLPETNDTGGQHFKLMDVFLGKLIGVTVEYGDDQIVYSGGEVEGRISSGVPYGAGYIPYRKGEGTKINAIKTHVASNEIGLFTFKDSAFGKFIFASDGGALMKDVNIAVGSMSPHSPHVAGNNLRFWSRDGAATVGNEENYGNLLRYSVLSLRADTITQQITASNLPDVCGVYFKNLSIFGISTQLEGRGNNACLVYDERYNSWTYWTNIHATHFVKVISPVDRIERLYYASNKTADIVEMFKGKTDYGTTGTNGTKITLSITTKQYDMGVPDQNKRYDKVTFVYGALFGNNTTIGVTRGGEKGIVVEPRYKVASDPILSGFGTEEWGLAEFGEGEDSNAGSSALVRFYNLRQRDLFWVKINIQNDGIADEFSLLGIYIYYAQSGKPLGHRLRIRTVV